MSDKPVGPHDYFGIIAPEPEPEPEPEPTPVELVDAGVNLVWAIIDV